MRYTLCLFFLLSGFWALNSPNDNGSLILSGLVSVLLVLLLSHKMKLLDQESIPLHLCFRIWPFYFWLTKEIIVGSLYVLARIIRRDKVLTPQIRILPLNFNDPLSKVIYANSITLVPGTLSIRLSKTRIQIHALSRNLADELSHGDLAQRIKRLEEK